MRAAALIIVATLAFCVASGAQAAPIDVSPFGNAQATVVAASATGSATCSSSFPCLAVSAVGPASACSAGAECVSLSASGSSTACDAPENSIFGAFQCIAISGLGPANACTSGDHCVAISVLGDANACRYSYLGGCSAISVGGDAEACTYRSHDLGYGFCDAISVLGDASGDVALSGLGSSQGRFLAVSGTGQATCDPDYHCTAVSASHLLQ